MNTVTYLNSQFSNQKNPEALRLLLQKNARIIEDPEKNLVLSYLRTAPIYLIGLGVARDLLQDPSPVVGSLTIRTDGQWAWQDYVAGYYEKYNLPLPELFFTHMRNSNWIPPKREDLNLSDLELDKNYKWLH